MVVYNITFHIDKDILEDTLTYIKKSYIPQAVASGFLWQPCLLRVMQTPQDEGVSYAVQFHVKNIDTLNYWMEKKGKEINQAITNRFGNKIVGFTTLLEEIVWEQ